MKEKRHVGYETQQEVLQRMIEQEGIKELTVRIDDEGYKAVARGGEGVLIQIDYFREAQVYVIQRRGTSLSMPAQRRALELEETQPKQKTEDVEILVKKENGWERKLKGLQDAGWRDGSTTEGIGVLVYSIEKKEEEKSKKQEEPELRIGVLTEEEWFTEVFMKACGRKIQTDDGKCMEVPLLEDVERRYQEIARKKQPQTTQERKEYEERSTATRVSITHQRQEPLRYTAPTTYTYTTMNEEGAREVREKIRDALRESFPNARERSAIENGKPAQFTIYFNGYRSKGVANDASLAQAYTDAVKQGIAGIFHNIAAVYKRKEEATQETEMVAAK